MKSIWMFILNEIMNTKVDYQKSGLCEKGTSEWGSKSGSAR